MLKNVRDKDLQLFSNLATDARAEKPEDLSLRILVPAFWLEPGRRQPGAKLRQRLTRLQPG